jgi:hypothetical protein
MTMRRELRAGCGAIRLLAGFVCAALLAQMALPALHAAELAGAPHGVATATATGEPVAAPAHDGTAGHDSAACVVCQSLLRTSAVLAPSLAQAERGSDPLPAASAAPLAAESSAARMAHPPRAPPASLLV